MNDPDPDAPLGSYALAERLTEAFPDTDPSGLSDTELLALARAEHPESVESQGFDIFLLKSAWIDLFHDDEDDETEDEY